MSAGLISAEGPGYMLLKQGGIDMNAPFTMLIDDEESFVETLAKRLSKRGLKTITAFSAQEGLEKMKTNEDIDVILLDIRMPGMDGIAALREIKKMSPLTEVIILTGHATIKTAIEGMKLGAYDFLKKPCDIEEVISKINGAFKKKQAHEDRIAAWKVFKKSSSLGELMVPLKEYATVSEDANILEAINALDAAQKAFDQNRYRHRAVLVMNKQKRIVGKLSQHDIIQALEPEYKESKERASSAHDHFGFSRKFIESVSLQYEIWDKPLQNLYKKALEQKVKSFMYKPSEGEYINVSASIDETIHQLIIGKHHSLLVTDNSKIVGVVRLTDVFEFIRLRLFTMQLSVQNGGEADGGIFR